MKPAGAQRARNINRFLAAAAVAVLLVSLALLAWLRRQAVADLDRDVQTLVASFAPERLLHGPGGDTLVRFDAAEDHVRRGLQSPYITDAALALKLSGGREVFAYPFTFAAEHADGAEKALAGFTAIPLGREGEIGRVYLRIDRTIVRRLNGAIGATALAILLVLTGLLARLWNQETSLTRTTIELHERRRELIRLERLALAGEISAGLLHDLRKPVLNIRHGVEEMREALGDFAGASPALAELERNAKLFFDMLGESRIERFVRSDTVSEEFVDVGPILDYSFSLVRYEQRGVQVERRDATDLPAVYAHPFKLIQLFSNLILNAYQALKGQGIVRAETAKQQGGVLVRISDNGPGIPADVQERIFDPFFSTKAVGEGTGLGLSICRLIAQEQGGWIRVESSEGGPTAFIVWLPGDPPQGDPA